MNRPIAIVADAAARREEKLVGVGSAGAMITHSPRSQNLGHLLPCPQCGRNALVWHVSAANRSRIGCAACGCDIEAAV